MAQGLTRRRILAGGGAGLGLAVAWVLWPRAWPGNLATAPGEHALGAWITVGEDGQVTLAVPQCEGGQGSWSALAGVAADEMGADWRQMAVGAAPVSGRFANLVGADALWEGMFDRVPGPLRRSLAEGAPLMLTAGSSSVRAFEAPVREAAAAARALLVGAAAARWGVEAEACAAENGFVTAGGRRLPFGALAAEAAGGRVPDPLPMRVAPARGVRRPRLDAPPKVDGSAVFAGDVRLPDMLHARAAAGERLLSADRAAAERVPGMRHVVAGDGWAAAVGITGWAAERGLAALAPRFEDGGGDVGAGLRAALAGPGTRVLGRGDPDAAVTGAGAVSADYAADAGLHGGLETASAAARFSDGRLELWAPSEAPAALVAAAARAAGVDADDVVLHPTLAGGAFGARLEVEAGVQAAVLARRLGRPVSLVWTRGEELRRGRHRSPALARMSARLGAGGRIEAWRAKLASAPTGQALADRLAPPLLARAAGPGDGYSVAGLAMPYAADAWAADHHPADLPARTGHLRGGMHGVGCFFREAFLDELAAAAGRDPLQYRLALLAGEPRLARCLSVAASLAGWDGGGKGLGIAAHAFRGSYVAVAAEVRAGADGRPQVARLTAAADCGRLVEPDLARQQVEGGLLFGLGLALGAAGGAGDFGALRLPSFAQCPEIAVEMIESADAPGGASELAVPPVAPAVAGAIWALTGRRVRRLPLVE